MLYEGRYSLKKRLLEFDRQDVYQAARADQESMKDWDKIKGQRNVETWEDMHILLGFFLQEDLLLRQAEKSKAYGALLGKLVKNFVAELYADTAIGRVQKWAAWVKDAVGAFVDLAKSHESVSDSALPNNPGMDAFMIDDAYSKILAPEMENEIMMAFLKDITGRGLTGKITGDTDTFDDFAEQWIEENIGDGAQTITGSENKSKLTDIVMPGIDKAQTDALLDLVQSISLESF